MERAPCGGIILALVVDDDGYIGDMFQQLSGASGGSSSWTSSNRCATAHQAR